jgi:hypothetical protein
LPKFVTVLGARAKAEHDGLAVFGKRLVQCLMNILVKGADMDAANLSTEGVNEWREYHDFRLLNVRLDEIDEIERSHR